MLDDIFKEKSPQVGSNGIAIFERNKRSFTFPIHIHDVFELNYVENAAGASRVVGSSKESISNKDLVLICNPTLEHAWQNGEKKSYDIHEITIQFAPSNIPKNLLNENDFLPIQRMFQRATSGLVFSQQATQKVETILKTIAIETDDFMLRMKFWMLLYTLSLDTESRQLNIDAAQSDIDFTVEKVKLYLRNNLTTKILMDDVAAYLGMSNSTFARFTKNATGQSFSTFLLNFRMDVVLRDLNGLDDELPPIKHFIENYGFSSIAYFYKVFKERTGMTPLEYLKKRKESLVRYI